MLINNKIKLFKLEEEYRKLKKVIIALSGGVDSCLAAFLGRKYLGKEAAIAVISDAPSLKRRDFSIAKSFCKKNDIIYEVVNTSELENENYISNPMNRCYICKNELYSELNNLVQTKFIGYKIINGNNYTDLGDYRPGLISANENKVHSPFIACGIDKNSIRELAKYFNLTVWDKPASPCLSSRFPYGEVISKDKLKRVELAEQFLFDYGFEQNRVRSYGDVAKIEVQKNKLSELKTIIHELEEKIISLGFLSVENDSEGLVSGKLNRVLNKL